MEHRSMTLGRAGEAVATMPRDPGAPPSPAGLAARIRLTGITKTFDTRGRVVEAVQATSLEIPDGQFVCLVGPSGCGKTTLLRIVAGLEQPTTGTIDVRRSAADRPLNAMIFQQESLFPWKTVWENVEFGLRVRGIPRAERRDRTADWLRKVGLHRFGTSYPYQLSGGMKQRVSIARAFALDPEILLMDEPFAALDQQTKLLLQEELLRVWSDTGKTVLFVTHNIDEATVLGDRVVVMTAHPGRIKAEVAVELGRPRDPMDVRADPRYMELTQEIWHLLRDEVLQARRQEEEESAT
jgi:NitT/TauT family transport system ATP-binding protein